MHPLTKWLCITLLLRATLGAAEPQTITWLLPTNSVLSLGVKHSMAAEATSKLPVRYKIQSGEAQIRGSFITPTAPGEVVVLAEQPGNSKWAPANHARTFQVVAAGETVFAEDFSKPLGPMWFYTPTFGPGVRMDVMATNGFLQLYQEKSPAPETLFTVVSADHQGAIFTDCQMSFEFWEWETTPEDQPLILGQVRVGDPRKYRSDWYCVSVLPKLPPDDPMRTRHSRLGLVKVKALHSTILTRTDVELLDPRKKYRVEISAQGTRLRARLTEVETNRSLGEIAAEDDEFKSGFCSIMVMDRAGSHKRGNFPVQLKADNYTVKGVRTTE